MAAIEMIKRVHCNRCDCKFNCNGCYYGQAIEALEKQIPKKPIGKHTDYKCSVCGRRVRSGKGSSSKQRDNFCQRCGQKLDWGEQNERT